MASIPLSEIPNLSLSSAPPTESAQGQGDTTYRQIRSSIDEGASALHQNLAQVAAPGEAISSFGKDITQAGEAVGQSAGQVGHLMRANAMATFDNNYKSLKSQFDSSLDPTHPELYAAKLNDFWNQNRTNMLAGVDPNSAKLIMPDLLRREKFDMADVSAKANIQNTENVKYNNLTAIQNNVNGGNFKDAASLLEGLNQGGALTAKEYQNMNEYVHGAQQKSNLTNWINADPKHAQDQFQWAIDNNKQLPGFDKITVEELKSYRNIAVQVGDKQTGQAFKDTFASIEDPKTRPQTLAQLQADPKFQQQDKEDQQKLSDQYLEKAKITDPSVVQAALDAKQAIHDFNPTNDLRPYQTEQQLYGMLSGVPKAQRAQLGGLIEDKMTSWIKGGGSLPADKVVDSQIKSEIITMGKAGLLGGDATDPVSIDRRTHDIENAFNTAWADPKQRGNASLQDARRIIDTLTQKNQWGAGASEGLNNKPSFIQKAGAWFKGADNSLSSPVGKVTSYGYKGDSTPDSNSAAGIGSQDNKLDSSSLAVSPDVEAKMKAQGINMGDPVQLQLADGSTVTKTLADRTAKSYKGKPLTGRFDFYSPGGVHPQDGVAVTGFTKGNS